MNTRMIIQPIQAWFLAQGRCAGCGEFLEKGRKTRKNGGFIVLCACKKTFLYNPRVNTYQRIIVGHGYLFLEKGENQNGM